MPESKRDLTWDKVDSQISGLQTDREWRIQVQREAIPLIFVPGFMGTRLRRAGSITTTGIAHTRASRA